MFARDSLLRAVLTLAVLGATGVFAEDEVFHQSFEEGMDGILTPTPATTSLSITNEEAQVFKGKAALKVAYPADIKDESQMPAVVIPGISGGFGGLALAVKAAQPTPLLCMAFEEDGSQYMAVASVPGGQWIELWYDRADFAKDKDKPDGNDRLDPEQVRSVVVCDLTFFLANMVPGATAPGVGERSLVIDEITIPREPRRKPVLVDGGLLIDGFSEPYARAVLAGVGTLGIEPREVGENDDGALLAKYAISQTTPMAGVLRPLPHNWEKPPTGIRFDAKVDFVSTIVASVEEADGSSYLRMLEPSPTAEWQTFEIPFGDFALSDDSQDENRRLDVDQVTHIMFGDAGGMMQRYGVNGLWLDNLVLLSE